MATRWQQRRTFGPRVLWSLPKGSFGFYLELQRQAHSSFSTNNITEQRFHRFLQPPSAIFQATSPFRLPKILLSVGTENSSRCLLQSSREWKPFSIKRNSERPNKTAMQSCEACWVLRTSHDWAARVGTRWPGHQRVTTLSPYPEASLSSADKLLALPGVVLPVGLIESHTCWK